MHPQRVLVHFDRKENVIPGRLKISRTRFAFGHLMKNNDRLAEKSTNHQTPTGRLSRLQRKENRLKSPYTRMNKTTTSS